MILNAILNTVYTSMVDGELTALRGWTDGVDCDGGGTYPAVFSKEVTFTDHTDVDFIKNQGLAGEETLPATSSTVSPATTIVYDVPAWAVAELAGDIIELVIGAGSNYSDFTARNIITQDDFIDVAGTLASAHEISPVPDDGSVYSGAGFKIHSTGKGITTNSANGSARFDSGILRLGTRITSVMIRASQALPAATNEFLGIIDYRLDASNEIRIFARILNGNSVFNLQIIQRVAGANAQITDINTSVNAATLKELVIEDDGVNITIYMKDEPSTTLTQVIEVALLGNTIMGIQSSDAVDEGFIDSITITDNTGVDTQNLQLTNCLGPTINIASDYMEVSFKDAVGTSDVTYVGKVAGVPISGSVAMVGTTANVYDGLGFATPEAVNGNGAIIADGVNLDLETIMRLDTLPTKGLLTFGLVKWAGTPVATSQSILGYGTLTGRGGWNLEFSGTAPNVKMNMYGVGGGNDNGAKSMSSHSAGDEVPFMAYVDDDDLYMSIDGNWAGADVGNVSALVKRGLLVDDGIGFLSLSNNAASAPTAELNAPVTAGNENSIGSLTVVRANFTQVELIQLALEHSLNPREIPPSLEGK